MAGTLRFAHPMNMVASTPRDPSYILGMQSGAVRQNTARSRFELEVDGHIAFANYRRDDGVVAITHTEVPPALRERGIGSRLVLGAMELARSQGLKVRPLCSFARYVIAQHPELRDLVA